MTRDITLIVDDLDSCVYVWRGVGVQPDGEGRTVTQAPVVRVTQPHLGHHLSTAVLHHLHLPRLPQVRRIVVDVTDIHLRMKNGSILRQMAGREAFG